MKKYIYIVMAVLSLGFASCSEELLPEEQLPINGEKKLVTLTVQAGTPTRLGIQENENTVSFTWEEGDVLHVVSGTDSYTDFILTEGAGTSRGIFTAEANFADGQNLQIVYSKNPDHPFQLDEDGNVQIDLSGQTGQMDEHYQYMYGTATYFTEGVVTTTLQHLVTTVKVELSVPEDFTGNIHQLRISDGYNNYRSSATLLLNPWNDCTGFDVQRGDLVRRNFYDSEGNWREPESNYDIVLNNIPLANSNKITVYLYLLGYKGIFVNEDNTISGIGTYNGMWPRFALIDEAGQNYVSTYATSRGFESGEMYRISKDCIKLVNFENEDQVDGSENSPYEIATADQFYSLMLRSYHNMTNKEGTSYKRCNYILTSDIELYNKCEWSSIELFENSSFDGAGHSIKGHQTFAKRSNEGGFFSLSNSKLKNLTLDADLHYGGSGRGLLSTLICEAHNSTIENCHNRSNVVANSRIIGGIIGYCDNCTLIGCSNISSLTYFSDEGWYSDTYFGGLISEAHNATLKACFSIAQLNNTYDGNTCFGGLIGIDFDSQIVGCWCYSQINNRQDNYYYGTLIGNANATQANYCYYNENTQAGPVGENYWQGQNTGSFSGSTPPTEQIASMNTAISDTDYQFNEDGTIRKLQGVIAPNMNKKEW